MRLVVPHIGSRYRLISAWSVVVPNRDNHTYTLRQALGAEQNDPDPTLECPVGTVLVVQRVYVRPPRRDTPGLYRGGHERDMDCVTVRLQGHPRFTRQVGLTVKLEDLARAELEEITQ